MPVVTIYEDDEMRVRADPQDWRGTMTVEKPVRSVGGHRWERVTGVQRIEFLQELHASPVVTITRVGQREPRLAPRAVSA